MKLQKIYQKVYYQSYINYLYKPQGYTSKQTYTLVLEEFPLPSLSYLKSLSKGGIDPISGLLLLENGSVTDENGNLTVLF